MSNLHHLFLSLLLLASFGSFAQARFTIDLEPIGGLDMPGASEIVAYDARSERLFVTTGGDAELVLLDISDPTDPSILEQIDLTPWGSDVNSVAVNRFGLVAVAIAADDKTRNGQVVFFDTDGTYLHRVTVGALPDMVTFDRFGTRLLVANEGEPSDDYTFDPEGSISIINIPRRIEWITQASVQNLNFDAFGLEDLDDSTRIFGPNASVVQDLEPEYIALSRNGRYAFVSCQENNAIAIVDVRLSEVIDIVGLGFKDHSLPGNGMDTSNDDVINIDTWPVFGMFQPDAIATFSRGGLEYVITANEGDAREYEGFEEEAEVQDVDLDDTAFPTEAALQLESAMGELRITTTLGDDGDDDDFERLYSYGGRSFSIWAYNQRTRDFSEVYESGDELEQRLSQVDPDNYPHGRADNKGPEPEGVTVQRLFGRQYAFIGLERAHGIIVYDVTDPTAPEFVDYINTEPSLGDSEPEGLIVIDRRDSPTRDALLVVTYEDSGTLRVFRINRVREALVE